MSLSSVAAGRSTSAVVAAAQSLKAIALLSCLGLLASVCMTTLGIDVGAGWL
jgi:hypothetical protein